MKKKRISYLISLSIPVKGEKKQVQPSPSPTFSAFPFTPFPPEFSFAMTDSPEQVLVVDNGSFFLRSP